MDPNQQPVAMPTPAPPAQSTVVPAENPGKTLGIVSLVTALIGLGLVGLITGIIGLKKSKAAGMSNGLALAGVIVSCVTMLIAIPLIALVVFSATSIVQQCSELGPGTHQTSDNVTITCG